MKLKKNLDIDMYKTIVHMAEVIINKRVVKILDLLP